MHVQCANLQYLQCWDCDVYPWCSRLFKGSVSHW